MHVCDLCLAMANKGKSHFTGGYLNKFSQNNQRETFSVVTFQQKPKKHKTGKRFMQFFALTIACCLRILGDNTNEIDRKFRKLENVKMSVNTRQSSEVFEADKERETTWS